MAKYEIFEETTTTLRHIVEANSVDEALDKWARGEGEIDPNWYGDYGLVGELVEINAIDD